MEEAATKLVKVLEKFFVLEVYAENYFWNLIQKLLRNGTKLFKEMCTYTVMQNGRLLQEKAVLIVFVLYLPQLLFKIPYLLSWISA